MVSAHLPATAAFQGFTSEENKILKKFIRFVSNKSGCITDLFEGCFGKKFGDTSKVSDRSKLGTLNKVFEGFSNEQLRVLLYLLSHRYSLGEQESTKRLGFSARDGKILDILRRINSIEASKVKGVTTIGPAIQFTIPSNIDPKKWLKEASAIIAAENSRRMALQKSDPQAERRVNQAREHNLKLMEIRKEANIYGVMPEGPSNPLIFAEVKPVSVISAAFEKPVQDGSQCTVILRFPDEGDYLSFLETPQIESDIRAITVASAPSRIIKSTSIPSPIKSKRKVEELSLERFNKIVKAEEGDPALVLLRLQADHRMKADAAQKMVKEHLGWEPPAARAA